MPSFERVVVLNQDMPAAVVEKAGCPSNEYGEEKSVVCGEWLVIHLTRGDGWCSGPGFEEPVRRGTLLSLPPGGRDFELRGDAEFRILAIREPCDQTGFTFPLVRHLSPFESRRWEHRLDETAHAIVSARFDAAQAVTLRDELAELRWLPAQVNGRHAVEDALRAMRDDPARPVRLNGLARELGYTANYLNDLTRIHTGRSLGRWLGDMRMSRARNLLAHSETPVAEVGSLCGYDDPAYFSRAFRRAHHISPAVWRIARRPQDARHQAVTMSLEDLSKIEGQVAVSF
jgi:AraC-like DNA-binding protein